MKRFLKILCLISLIPFYGQIASGCIGGAGPGGGGGIGGAFNSPTGLPTGGEITPPPGGGGETTTPPPGAGAASPTQPGQEGIGKKRPFYVLVNVLRPIATTSSAMKRLDNGSLGDAPLENAPPEDPFPGEKPLVFLRTEKPDYTLSPQPTDAQGSTTFYYYAEFDSSSGSPVCVTKLYFYATYHEGTTDYRSQTATVTCTGNYDDAPTVNLQLATNPLSDVAAPDGGVMTQ